MKTGHSNRTVLTRYTSTRVKAQPLEIIATGQLIPIVRETCKVRCECGCIYLDECLFVAGPPE